MPGLCTTHHGVQPDEKPGIPMRPTGELVGRVDELNLAVGARLEGGDAAEQNH